MKAIVALSLLLSSLAIAQNPLVTKGSPSQIDVVLTTGKVAGFGEVVLRSISPSEIRISFFPENKPCQPAPGTVCVQNRVFSKEAVVSPTFLVDARPRDGALAIKLTDEFTFFESEGPYPGNPRGARRFAIGYEGKYFPLHNEVRITFDGAQPSSGLIR